jgi:hypothetical protein
MDFIPSIVILSGGAALVAIVGFTVVNRFMKPIDVDQHQGFLDAMLSIVGTLVSILLGLIVAASLDHYQAIEQSVDTEAAAISQVIRLSTGLPKPVRKNLRRLAVDYGNLVITDEWPKMAQGVPSEKVLLTLAELIGEISVYKPADNGESNLHAALLASVQQAADCRRQRLLVMHSAWKDHLMPVLLLCSFIVLVFAFLYAKKGAILHCVLICFVAIALGGNLGLIFLLNNPFSGDWKIQPRGFQLNAILQNKLRAMPELQRFANDD